MKVYRIKHKPSWLYYNRHKKQLTENGAVYESELVVKIAFPYVLSMYKEQCNCEYSDFEIIEYGLVEIHYPKELGV